MAQLRERMRNIQASAIVLSGQLGEVPRSGTEPADRVSSPPLSGNGAKRKWSEAEFPLNARRLGEVADGVRRNLNFRKRSVAQQHCGFPSYRRFAKPLVIGSLPGLNPFVLIYTLINGC